MLTLAVAALLAVVASAQPGVVLFAEGEHQGALLHTPSPGSLACAEDPHADCAPLEPSAAAAAVAALLQVNPVELVDAQASSQVRHSPHGTAGSPDPTHAIPPTFPFLDASADPSETRSSNIRAHSRTAQVASLLDRDPSRRPGTVIVAHVASARAASALEDFLAAPRGAAPSGKTGASARRAADLGAVHASLDALACAPGVARVRVGDADIGDPVAFGDAVARAVAEARHQSRGGGAENATSATLVMASETAATTAFFVETEDATGDVAFADVVFASARAALERARAALGGDAVLVVLVSDGVGGPREQRRRLRQDVSGFGGASTFAPSNGNATVVADKTRRFRDATSTFAVFFLLLVISVCGIMAMASMTFPSDSLLYPREKND